MWSHAVAHGDASDRRADFYHLAGDFVSHNHRQPGRRRAHLGVMNRQARAACAHLDQRLLRTRPRNRTLLQLERRADGVQHHRSHTRALRLDDPRAGLEGSYFTSTQLAVGCCCQKAGQGAELAKVHRVALVTTPLTSSHKSMLLPEAAAEISTALKSHTGYASPSCLSMRLVPAPRLMAGPPSTDAYNRTVGFQRHGTGWVVVGVSRIPVTLAVAASRGQTTWIGASTAVGSGVTCSTTRRGSPPTR